MKHISDIYKVTIENTKMTLLFSNLFIAICMTIMVVATSTTDVDKRQEKNIINDDIVLKVNNNNGQNEELYTLMHDNYYYHRECIHIHDDTFEIENLENGDEYVTVNDKKSLYKKCPYPRIHRSSIINDNKINNNNNIIITTTTTTTKC